MILTGNKAINRVKMIADLITHSEALIQQLDNLRGDGKIASDTRTYLSAGCFDFVLEHHKAILVLVDRSCFGSAFALDRPQ
jgi:hypothetical protein